MQVKLRWITPDPEETIAYIARVSNPQNQSNPNYVKLVKYLIQSNHWSPFEMSNATFEITTSRAIAAQILRHKSFSFQEFSQRYAVVDSIQPIEIRKQAIKNRQSSEEVFDPVVETVQHERDWDASYDIHASEAITKTINHAFWTYTKLINAGVAKETARMLLPLATTTTLYMNGTIRSWIHYLTLRNDAHAQKEHQLIAQEIESILRQHLPIVFAALDSIKADKENDALLLNLIKGAGVTDAEYLEHLLTTTWLHPNPA